MSATTTGATATVDSDRPPPLPLDSIPIIDLSLLSQSELFSLSMCSNSSFDLNRCDDVVIPKIDRSAFNESAGSRKQTYSRLRLAPAQSPTSLHRRTPRLRSSHAPTPNNINGAEQAENSQIIRMLKELFKSDHSFEDLVPIEVEKDTNALVPVVVPELLTPETTRKRGRPRSNEKAVFINPPAAKKMCNSTVKKVVAYDAVRDIEMVNSRGVKVDLEKLGRLEDPYGLEIRRRTAGMSTKDELLGFLGGLVGDWGTSRKKKKIVDASYFGDALPKGWKLCLSIKKKLGRVWLFCRRYISPSGRQFDSCKETSVYLLSLVGEEKLDKPTHTQSNKCDNFASKGASVNALSTSLPRDLKKKVKSNIVGPIDVQVKSCAQETITRKRPVVLALSTSVPRDFKKKVKSNIVGPIDVQVKEVFKCLKCFLIFKRKIGLLDHQVLAHKTETSKLGSETSEWMVVKGGIFECHFCNKTFKERNRYNAHIGTHDTFDKKTSEAPSAEKTVVMESHDAPSKLVSSSSQIDDKISCGIESEIKEHVHVHDLNMNEDVLIEKSGGEIEEKCDVDDKKTSEEPEAHTAEKTVVIESHDELFGDKLVSSSSSSQSDDKISHGTEAEIYEHVHVHDLNILAHDNQGGPVNMNEDVLVEESGGEIEKKCNVDDIEFPEIDKDPNVSVSVSKSDFCLDHEASISINESNVNLETSVGTVDYVEKDIASKSSGLDAVSETGVTHVDDKLECILEKGKSSGNTPVLPSTNDNVLVSVEKNVVGESGSDEVVNLADSETRVESSTICEKKGFWENINDANICSSFDDLASEKEKVMNENCVDEMKKKLPDSVTETETLTLVSPPSIKPESPQKVGFTHDFEENRVFYGVVDGQHEVRNNSVIETQTQTQMNMEDFHMKNDVNNDSSLNNRSSEVNLDDFHIFTNDESVNNEEDTGGVMGLEFCSLVPPAVSVNEGEFRFQDDDLYESGERGGFLDHFSIPETYDDMFDDEERGIGIHELTLAFGNGDPHEQKKEDTFDVQTDLSMVNNTSSMLENRQSVGGSFSNNNNGNNVVYPDTTWGSGLGNANGNGVFGVDEQVRYNNDGGYSGLNGLRAGRSEAVEFRFLSGRSEGGGFPYNISNTGGNGMEQGGFWNGKNGRNVITGVCGWCRNEFHILPETQGGVVASLCPSCSAGMSGQVNML